MQSCSAKSVIKFFARLVPLKSFNFGQGREEAAEIVIVVAEVLHLQKMHYNQVCILNSRLINEDCLIRANAFSTLKFY